MSATTFRAADLSNELPSVSAAPATAVREASGILVTDPEENSMSWNDERVESLRKMWMDGLSASQIAAELGNGITRNAVIGKVHRLGLSGRVKAPSSAPSRPRIQQPRPARNPAQRRPSGGGGIQGNTALAYSYRPQTAPAPKPVEDVVVPMCDPVTIMDLRETMCRWPLGDPSTSEFRYCGGKSDVGVSYCAYHSRMAYQPAQERRRERDRERRAQQRLAS